jgi:hypothetical protein
MSKSVAVIEIDIILCKCEIGELLLNRVRNRQALHNISALVDAFKKLNTLTNSGCSNDNIWKLVDWICVKTMDLSFDISVWELAMTDICKNLEGLLLGYNTLTENMPSQS